MRPAACPLWSGISHRSSQGPGRTQLHRPLPLVCLLHPLHRGSLRPGKHGTAGRCSAASQAAPHAHDGRGRRGCGAHHHVRSRVQAVEALSDGYMHIEAGSTACLLSDLSDALALPAALKMKWLRADCLTDLDLSAPGDGWGLTAWQQLVMCLHVVPALEALAVCLPRYAPQSLRQAVERPLTVRECNLCNQTGILHFHCSDCRCGPSAARVQQRHPRSAAQRTSVQRSAATVTRGCGDQAALKAADKVSMSIVPPLHIWTSPAAPWWPP